MNCPACGAENRFEGRFCRRCGVSLATVCPNGHPVDPGDLFCDTCGASLEPILPGQPAEPSTSPHAERRLVTVLFADLVGFTPLAESRDAEEVRDILSSYFDRMRGIVERHGGTVEKFIGDAVMAVWGTPVAHEDDAERAVRAGLAMADAVDAMNAELALPPSALEVRVGVMTGEAAITVGAKGQGMVAGDLVNTASRVQAGAAAGTVLVGEATRRSTDAAITYEQAGAPELKGKTAPVQVWRAMRVVAGRRGAGRSEVLEAPFVGRDREMRLVKDLFHATAHDRRAHLVSVTGIAGIGKSRLSWEFEKYVDGLIDKVWWHRGRCLAYGEGVAYWALAEMVRMRAGIAEEEEPASAIAKLRDATEHLVPDAEERRWIEPRLAHLLALEERSASDREDLFSGWRLFFERMAQVQPTVLVFEDLQWADASLLDFIEHLMEWSKDHALYVLTLARPELADRRPAWGARGRNFTSIALEPLSPEAVERLLDGLVPGIPDDLRNRIRDRTEGVPLFAIETVRMLLDRGFLEREGDRYRIATEVEILDVPETLHALISARLDALPPVERGVVLHASVLGKTFTRQGLLALTGLADAELDAVLATLVRKELLSLQADPRSPERGQYGFLQSLVREVAYQTLSRKERKVRHLAVARFLTTSWTADDGELVEVVASHYVEAYRAVPDAPDAEQIRAEARKMLVRAGERAMSLAASSEAQGYFEQAMEFAEEPLARAGLSEQAGIAAMAAGRRSDAERYFEEAIALFEAEGRGHPAARVSARLADVLWDAGHIEDGIERMERAHGVLVGDEPDEDLAVLTHQLGRMRFFAGDIDGCAEMTEAALEIAERLWVPEVLSHALNTKSLVLMSRGHFEEGDALLRRALQVALENDVPQAAFRAYYNLYVTDRLDEVEEFTRRGLELARRLGNRQWEANFIGRLAFAQWLVGDWDGALESEHALVGAGSEVSGFGLSRTLGALVHIHVNRGELDQAERLVSMREVARESAGVIERLDYETGRAIVARARGDLEDARRFTDRLVSATEKLGTAHETVREGCLEALEVSLDLGDLDRAEALFASFLTRTSKREYLRIMMMRFAARIAAARGDSERAEGLFRESAGVLREFGAPFPLAVALLEHAELLQASGRGHEAEPMLAEAREIFAGLKATPWLDRLSRVGADGARV